MSYTKDQNASAQEKMSQLTPLEKLSDSPTHAQSLFEAVCNNATLGLFIMNEHQHCSYMNPAAEELTGFSLAEVQGAPLHDFIHHTHPDGSHYPLSECPIDRAFPENNQEQGEAIFIHKDGSFYPVAFTASPIQEQGKPVGTIIEVRATATEKREQYERDTIFQLTQTLFVAVDKTGHFQYINKAFSRILGWSESEILGHLFLDFIHPEDIESSIDILTRAQQGEKINQFINRYRCKDESYRSLMWTNSEDPNDELTYALGIDVTQQQQQEKADLLLTKMTQLTQSPSDPDEIMKIFITELGQFMQVNRCSYIEVGPDQNAFVMGPNYVYDTFPMQGEFQLTDFGEEVQKLFIRGEDYILSDTQNDFRSYEQLDAYNQFEIRAAIATPLIKNNKLVACFLVHQKHPRKWTKEEIELIHRSGKLCWETLGKAQANQRLRESEARFRFLAESMPQKIFTATPAGDVDYFNEIWTEFTGLSLESIRDWGWLQFVHPDDQAENIRCWQHAIDTGEPYQFEHRFRRADGVYRWHLTRAQAMRNEKGEIQMWIGSNTEVDDIKQAKANLEKSIQLAENSRQIAEKANQAKSKFLANLSHELRTPLNAVIGFSELMHQEAELSPAQQKRIRSIMVNSRHLLAMLNEILELAKIEAGQIKLNPTSFELSQVLDEIQLMFSEAASLRRNRLKFSLAPDLPQYIFLDQVRLQEILVNFVSNAVKFTQAGEITLQVKPGIIPETLLFSIQDTGLGIAEDELSQLFKPFMQTRSGKASGQGTGLGLAISQEFIHLMGGKLKVESTLQQGSHFSFTMPYQVSNEAQSGIRTGDSSLILEMERSLLILIADDNSDNRELLRDILTPLGFETHQASNGKEVIQFMETQTPDLILMDLSMPEIDGFEATRLIRKNVSTDLPIIAVTANAFLDNRQQALAAGMNAFVTKPFQRNQLLKILAEQLKLNYRFEKRESLENTVVQDNSHELSFPDLKWQEAFQNSLQNLDVDQIEDQLSEIENQHPIFYSKVNNWIQNFAYDQITDWLNQEPANRS